MSVCTLIRTSCSCMRATLCGIIGALNVCFNDGVIVQALFVSSVVGNSLYMPLGFIMVFCLFECCAIHYGRKILSRLSQGVLWVLYIVCNKLLWYLCLLCRYSSFQF